MTHDFTSLILKRELIESLFVTMSIFAPSNIFFSGNASYNSLIEQVAFCKMQGFDTVSRQTSMAPKMFLDGRVKFGVGLSDVQFQGKTASCGQCINVTRIENFFEYNDALTVWNESDPIETPFTVFVMDQCTDEVCKSGYLDFDVYSPTQPVMHGNPYGLEWQFVDCPVKEDLIELLFCFGSDSCNQQNVENRSLKEVFHDAMTSGYWFMYPRNFRVPIVNIILHLGDQSYPLVDDSGWKWMHWEDRLHLLEPWRLELQGVNGNSKTVSIDWTSYLNQSTSPGYRGGFLLETNVQN